VTPALEPAPEQSVVVVAREHDHLASGPYRRAQRAQDRRGLGEHLPQRTVAKFEHVAQQDEPIDVRERLHEHVPLGLAAQHVLAPAGAQVKIGDDERAQLLEAPRRRRPPCPGGSPWGA
jgi:hypothetical protein